MGKNVFEIVKEKFIDGLKENGLIWRKNWTGKDVVNSNLMPVSYATGKAYSGINRYILPIGEYVTFNQIKKLKGKLNKGSKSEIAVFWNVSVKDVEEENENGEIETVKKTRFFLRYYRVFNIEDTNLEPKYAFDVEPVTNVKLDENKQALNDLLMNYMQTQNINYKQYGTRCFYSPSMDNIVTPKTTEFDDTLSFLKSLAHEVAHSTGHENRLNRIKGASFGSEVYSYEELVAETTATMLCSQYLGIENVNFDNSQAYINHWINYFKEESAHKLVSAFTKAEKALDFIFKSSPSQDTKEEEKQESEEISDTVEEIKSDKTYKPKAQWLEEQEIIKNKYKEFQKDYPKLKKYKLVFNEAKSSYGIAKYGKKVINISLVFLAYNPVEKMLDTLAHEVAHVLLETKTRTRKIKPHGKEWRRLARQLGSDGKATHPSANPIVGKYKAVCNNCGKVYYLHKKTRNFNSYYCNCDKVDLVFKPTPKEDFAPYLLTL